MDLRYWIWLAEALGPGSHAVHPVLEAFQMDAEAVWHADADAIGAVQGLANGAKAALLDKSLTRAEAILADCKRLHISVLTCADPAYPKRLFQIADPPVLLYYFGRLIDLDDQVCIATVGTRKTSLYGERMAYTLSLDLALGGAIIVSGMAAGIDGICHRAAIDAGKHTIAVLGCGLDRVYPAQHRPLMTDIARRGTLFTEYPPGTPPIGRHFPVRNRIISGLSLGTLVVEADEKSGSLITARVAKRQKRDVFALPGNVGEQNTTGTLKLLAEEDARLVVTGADILAVYEKDWKHRINIQAIPAFQPKHTVSPIRRAPAQGVQAREIPDEAPLREEPLPFTDEAAPQQVKKAPTAQGTRQAKKPPKPTAMELPVLSTAEQKVFSLFGSEPMSVDDLAEQSGETVSAVLGILTLLEIKGCVRAVAGGAYQSNFQS